MANVSFEEPSYGAQSRSVGVSRSVLSRLVISLGLAKDDAGAQRVLLITAVVALAITAVVLVFSGISPSPEPVAPTNPPGVF